ncbi:MAG TPA: CRISPR system precrRNA processing endoribonuclease RAMP protein Cas6 [Bryobacteraceae bacterium]
MCFNSSAGGDCAFELAFEPAFELVALRLRFTARQSLHFPPGESANLLRGRLGKALMEASAADYARLFAPRREYGPSGLRDPPRPFVLRVAHLEGAHVPAGGGFEIGVNLFDTRVAATNSMSAAVRAAMGGDLIEATVRPLRLSLGPYARPVHCVRVQFVTPTELKNAPSTSGPEFGVLFARIRDRVSALRSVYGAGPLPIDFRGMGRGAKTVRMTRSNVQLIEAQRLSRNTGLRHPLGGFIGVAEYQGELAEFVPYLEAARWTGLGRQTVWGKGEIDWEEI